MVRQDTRRIVQAGWCHPILMTFLLPSLPLNHEQSGERNGVNGDCLSINEKICQSIRNASQSTRTGSLDQQQI